MSGGNRKNIDKSQLRKTLYIECTKHNLQRTSKGEFLGREAKYEAIVKKFAE